MEKVRCCQELGRLSVVLRRGLYTKVTDRTLKRVYPVLRSIMERELVLFV